MLQPPSARLRERILAMGTFGSGKTHAWLKIAEWMQRSESPGTVYVIDSDEAALHMMLTPTSAFKDLTNVKVTEVYEWEDYRRAVDELVPILTPVDWLVIDFAGKAWDAVQDWYVAQMYDQDIADFFFQAAKNAQAGNPLDGWKDWTLINKEYRRWIDKVIHKHRAHLFLTAVADTLRETDAPETKVIFGRLGVRPRSQKHLPHQVNSVLLMQIMGKEYYLTSAKDRERPLLAGQKTTDFAIDYLVNVAGWTL